MENKTITIQGKTIDYGKLSNEKLIQLYRELKQRELILYNKIMEYDEEYHFLPEVWDEE